MTLDVRRAPGVSIQAIAFSVLRAVAEYISRVNPLTRRLIPRRVPMARDELEGHGRQIKYAKMKVRAASKGIHTEPEKLRK